MRFFVLLILVLTTRFYGLNFLEKQVPFDILNLVCAGVLIFFCILKKELNYGRFRDLKVFMRLAILAVLLSFIVSYLDWGQSFLVSGIASRSIFWISFGFFLIRFNILKSEITYALKYFTVIYFIIAILAKLSPGLNFLFSGVDYKGDLNTTSLFLGIEFVILFFYLKTGDLLNKSHNLKNYIWFFTLLILIVLTENRTMLFSSILIIGANLLISKKYNFFYKIILIAVIFQAGYLLFSKTFMGLIDETLIQLADQDYNRNKAFDYLIFELNNNWYSKILGNGFASLHSSYGHIVADLKTQGIYQSDMGLLGLWSIYGLIILYAIIRYIFRIITEKRTPLYLKLQSYHILLGFLMYSFVLSQQIVFFLLFFYLYEIEKKQRIEENRIFDEIKLL